MECKKFEASLGLKDSWRKIEGCNPYREKPLEWKIHTQKKWRKFFYGSDFITEVQG